MARGRLLRFVYGAVLVPGAQAIRAVDGIRGSAGSGRLLRMRIVWHGRFCTKIGHLIEDMWEMIVCTPSAGASSLLTALDGTCII